MDKELAERIYLDGTLIEPVGAMEKLQKPNQLVVELDGKLYVLTIEEIP
jgi:hypothetical protein